VIDLAGDPKSFDDPSGENTGLTDGEVTGIVGGILSLTFVLVLCLLLYVHNYRKFRYWLARHSNISYEPTPGSARRFAEWFNAAFECLSQGARIPRDRLAERRDTFLRWFRHLAEGIKLMRFLREHWSRSNGRTEEVEPNADLSGLHVEDPGHDGANGVSNQNVDLERPVEVNLDEIQILEIQIVHDEGEVNRKKKKKNPLARLPSGHSCTFTTVAEVHEPAMNSLELSIPANNTRSQTRARSTLEPAARPVGPPPKAPAGPARKRTKGCGVCLKVHEAGQECFVDLGREARLVEEGEDRETPNSRYDPTAPPESLLGETPDAIFKTAKQNLATKRRKIAKQRDASKRQRLESPERSSSFSADLDAMEVTEDSLSQDTSARKILFDKTGDPSSQDEDSENGEGE
jgi:hypothetical protein